MSRQSHDDLRLHRGFLRHPKTKRLRRTLGADAVLSLEQLWCYAAENAPNGDLMGLDDLEVALAADWAGDPGEFVRALLDVGFLDGSPGSLRIHDWLDHQPWIARRPALQERSRRANDARWAKRRTERESGNRSKKDSNKDSLMESNKGSSPTRTPPLLKRGEEKEQEAGGLAAAGPYGPPLASGGERAMGGPHAASPGTCRRGPFCAEPDCCATGRAHAERAREVEAYRARKRAPKPSSDGGSGA